MEFFHASLSGELTSKIVEKTERTFQRPHGSIGIPMRIALLLLLLAALFVIPFLLLGSEFDAWLTTEGAVNWLRSFGVWAWAVAILLLLSDLVLPVPATAVMAGLGIIYGPVAGGLIGAAGSCLAGLVGYGACRLAGRRAALFLAGKKDLERGERFFSRSGGWAVVLSRWMPLLPEVVACMAGLMRMPISRFLAALVCGSLPMAVVFASLGHAAVERPVIALSASALAPLLLWFVAMRFLRGPGN